MFTNRTRICILYEKGAHARAARLASSLFPRFTYGAFMQDCRFKNTQHFGYGDLCAYHNQLHHNIGHVNDWLIMQEIQNTDKTRILTNEMFAKDKIPSGVTVRGGIEPFTLADIVFVFTKYSKCGLQFRGKNVEEL